MAVPQGMGGDKRGGLLPGGRKGGEKDLGKES